MDLPDLSETESDMPSWYRRGDPRPVAPSTQPPNKKHRSASSSSTPSSSSLKSGTKLAELNPKPKPKPKPRLRKTEEEKQKDREEKERKRKEREEKREERERTQAEREKGKEERERKRVEKEREKLVKQEAKAQREREKVERERESRTCSATVWVKTEAYDDDRKTHDATDHVAKRYAAPCIRLYVDGEFMAKYGSRRNSLESVTFESEKHLHQGMIAMWLNEYTKAVPGSRLELRAHDNEHITITVVDGASEGLVELPESWKLAARKRISHDEVSSILCGRFISEPHVSPLFHQRELLSYLDTHNEVLWPTDPRKKGLLLMWKMGSGKTRGSGQIADLIARKVNGFKGVVVIAHKTNLGNWMNTFRRMPQAPGTNTSFTIVNRPSFVKRFGGRPKDLKGCLVVVDESQIYENTSPEMLEEIAIIKHAAQIVCLSGTPIMNDIKDVRGFMILTLGWEVEEANAWVDKYMSSASSSARSKVRENCLREFREGCKDRISYFDPEIHTPVMFRKNFPVIKRIDAEVSATWIQAVYHQMYEVRSFKFPGGNEHTFTGLGSSFHSLTQIIMLSTIDLKDDQATVNRLSKSITAANGDMSFTEDNRNLVEGILETSPKIQTLMRNIQIERLKGKPQVVHCRYVDMGGNMIAVCLGVSHPDMIVRMIDGSDNAEKRTELVTAFSSRLPPKGAKKAIDVLIITDASAVGTDLLGAGALHLTTTFNNRATEDQTLGRVARFRSHKEGDELVIYKYVLTFETLFLTEMNEEDVNVVKDMLFNHFKGNKTNLELVRKLTASDICMGFGLEHGLLTYDEKLPSIHDEKDATLKPILDIMKDVSFTVKRE